MQSTQKNREDNNSSRSRSESPLSQEEQERRKKLPVYERTLEEKIMSKKIKAVEKDRLIKVFNALIQLEPKRVEQEMDGNKTTDGDTKLGKQKRKKSNEPKFSAKAIYAMMKKLKYTPIGDEVERMIWEIDEDLDEQISWYEFQLMFKRCIKDTSYLEPRGLFNFVQFLMYAYDKEAIKNTITVEDTLELLYVRCGRQNLDGEIFKIFGQDEKTADGQEKEITYSEYLAQMKKKDFNNWTELENKKKKYDPSKEQNINKKD
ncbi:unnamed protein product (macronuclear) [Paramecium tetraurelia]|uniref:EF-hand domain-containing protein n=1 Tax=Paramecium tetraurelia TaxID=5888 RepID=A0C7Q4_PARTE|nr:uncharacterized protein GSPATT00035952001 [Paramecium tetraurelia]CAK66821.1 unnamed protein product [Paramecium tetraurelia]|eukprot:XP_001434218.1 hypothetical protein (macronuclear) [Paramecium tetraurelia strain d4-2]